MSAPTGGGKSLTFELAPYTFDHLFGEDCNAIVLVRGPGEGLVIVPLISLMKDQVSNLNSRGVRASYVPRGYFKSERENSIWETRGDPQHHPHPVKLTNKGFVLVDKNHNLHTTYFRFKVHI